VGFGALDTASNDGVVVGIEIQQVVELALVHSNPRGGGHSLTFLGLAHVVPITTRSSYSQREMNRCLALMHSMEV